MLYSTTERKFLNCMYIHAKKYLFGPYFQKKLFSNTISNDEVSAKKLVGTENKEISKAMKAYLERAKEHDEFMKKEKIEYQIGKRHLANMMGEDPETFTQEDVNVSKL